MDSTIVKGETLDDLAEFAQVQEEVAEITHLAMNGKLDFHQAIRERVKLLKGLEASALRKTLEKTQISPGAQKLIRVMREHGAICILVSGGFTFFTSHFSKTLGFHMHHGNEIEIEDGKLTGKVIEPILDKYAKLELMKEYIQKSKITAHKSMAIGDGANDLPMLKAAGLGIGYRCKDVVAKEIPNIILHGDLSAALYAQGYTASDLT
jgi:phosphoserine phosphatase